MKTQSKLSLNAFTILSAALTIASVASGCGGNTNSTNPTNSVIPSSSTQPTGSSTPVVDINTKCSQAGGTVITSSTGQVCRTDKSFNGASFGTHSYGYSRYGFSLPLNIQGENSLYRVANNNPFVMTGMEVKANDLVTYSVIGNYGTTSYSTGELWGFLDYSVASTDCATFDEDFTLSGKWAGLIAHDGATTYELRSTNGAFTARNSGKLAFGFDVPSSWVYACGMIQVNTLTVTHCEDAAGTSVACPQ